MRQAVNGGHGQHREGFLAILVKRATEIQFVQLQSGVVITKFE